MVEFLSLLTPDDGTQPRSLAATIIAYCAVAVLTLVSIVVQIALFRMFIAAAEGQDIPTRTLLVDAARRTPYVVAMLIGSFAAMCLVILIPGLIAYLEPLTMIVLVPLALVAGIGLAPYLFAYMSIVIGGPRVGVVARVRDEVTHRWWYVLRCSMIIGLACSFATFAMGVVFFLSNAVGGFAAVLAAIATTTLQIALAASGGGAAHHQLNLPTDPALLGPTGR